MLASCTGGADKPRLRACSQAVKAFVHADPYTKAGLIDKWCGALPRSGRCLLFEAVVRLTGPGAQVCDAVQRGCQRPGG